ncbi:hypothetical protein SAMN04488121_102442 [Chitinophaga filiformis]|uniref:Lipoprotein n=1 Tax=Chitinophaga filiformis TaxID=104663 RepID=A0A1G7MI76_CHIFI|nr:hypothetical protein SAMN04488121_102442 [Chitinophaga filiformis]
MIRSWLWATLVTLMVGMGCKQRYVDSDPKMDRKRESIYRNDTSLHSLDSLQSDKR